MSEPHDDFQRWRFGEITITSVVEAQTDGIPPEFFFPSATGAGVATHSWVVPTFADEQGRIGMRVQALVVDTPTRRILVDPCVGNGKTLSLPFWNDQDFPFLERFAAAGFAPETIDLVVHTHLHEDHVGWDTHRVNASWVPTFRNARHLYVREALDALRRSERPDAQHTIAESIEPVIAAGLADLVDEPVDEPLDLGEGIQLVSTPGHMIGHVSMTVAPVGDDRQILVTGDFVHHPVQFAEPDWAEVADVDAEQARSTRRRMFADAAERDLFVIGTHFPTSPAGRVVADGAVWRFDPAPPSALG